MRGATRRRAAPGCRIGPLQVVDRTAPGGRSAEPRQQLLELAEGLARSAGRSGSPAVARARLRGERRHPRSTGNTGPGSASPGAGAAPPRSSGSCGEVLAERVDHRVERLEGHRLLLVAAAREDDAPRDSRAHVAVEEAAHQRALAHARTRRDDDRTRRWPRRQRRARRAARELASRPTNAAASSGHVGGPRVAAVRAAPPSTPRGMSAAVGAGRGSRRSSPRQARGAGIVVGTAQQGAPRLGLVLASII